MSIKDILKMLPSIGISNYIKILQRQCSRKRAVKELSKMEKDKTVVKKVPPVLYLYNPVFGLKIFVNNKK